MSVYNASKWLEEVLGSVAAQKFAGSLELSVFDDASAVRRTISVKLRRSWAGCRVFAAH